MANKEARLKRYRKRKLQTKNSEKLERWTKLYWRYHFQVYGPHTSLWNTNN